MNNPISISHLLLGYDRSNPLLPAFSVDAHKGEFIALIGRNGIGKSTFIRTIIGSQQPLEGAVNLQTLPLKKIGRTQKAKLIAYVPSEQVRIPNLFIRDFISLARFPHLGWSKSLSLSDWEVVDNALLLVGIEHLANRDIATVSDGERQRAMIAFALAQDSNIILLDEPTAFLDLPNKFEMVRLLSNLARNQRKTIIYSTHDLQGAITEADTIWMMLDTGFISGCPEDIVLNSHFDKLLGNSHIVFERETGVFKNHRKAIDEIALEGQDDALFWTKKMLERLGYTITAKPKSGLRVECLKDNRHSWKVYTNGILHFEAYSLTELSKRLMQGKP
ncbi:MAG: ABC transporter ATP-binding protein [Bacteroidales bacterium]|nr:ABC transporter ATP-binding protein [Bacteroidales bacterium]MDY0196761.1 ABC transporter ATP-binding protein [Tenuifilaceae bacterium]